jgi:CDGSH-type Zn-finger protein
MALNTGCPMREELVLDSERVALCRCWQSKKFPYCDGSHREYNRLNDDQLGPVIVTHPVLKDT